jgi:hypothetical protein
MRSFQRAVAILTVSGALVTVSACNGGLLGNILGGGSQQQASSGQVNGTVLATDLRNYRIEVRDNSNSQSFWVSYDNRTQVSYRNQNVAPTSIRQGDNVTLQVQNNGNNSYYTNYVQIN